MTFPSLPHDVTMRRRDVPDDVNDLSYEVIGLAIEFQRRFGPGLLESFYGNGLAHLLRARGRRVDREVPIRASIDGVPLGTAFRADMLVEHKLLVEVKAVQALNPVHFSQVATYLRIGGWPLALLINFHASPLKNGTHRIAATA